jgi:S-DNA-T family DNA segregation ATPase FtsK/SpoIIIE
LAGSVLDHIPMTLGRRTFNRPPRLHQRLSLDTFQIPDPPTQVSRASGSVMGRLLIPLVVAVVTGGIFLLFALTSTGQQRTLMLAAAVAMLAVAAIPTVWSFFEDRRTFARDSRKQRADYQARLTTARQQLEALRDEEHRLRLDLDPPPEVLRQRAKQPSPRLWERGPTDDDFLRLRLGQGAAAALLKISCDVRATDLEWDLGRTAAQLNDEFRTQADVPILADLKSGAVGLAGPAEATAGLARALLSQAAVQHSPDELWLAAFLSPQSLTDWAWLKWLPHVRPRRTSDPGRTLLACDPLSHQTQARWLLGELTTRKRAADEFQAGRQRFEAPWLLIFVEDASIVHSDAAFQLALTNGPSLRVAVLVVAEDPTRLPDRCKGVIAVAGQRLNYAVTEPGVRDVTASVDQASTTDAESIARALAPLVPARPVGQGESDIPTRVGFFEALGVGSVEELNLETEWLNRDTSQWLRIPLGIAAGSKLVELDFKEQALGGHGPHGLVAGTTGAGKSELLLTLIAGLALRHPPDVLNFVLVDYKGGDAFRSVADLPHTVALITDLDKHLAGRALVALKSELKRRERRMGELKDAGVTSVAEYQRIRGQRPMPFLVIVVDEFARLKDELPEFIHGLIDVARVGRSLGVHLILATQTPSGTVDDEIQKNVNFGICLRVRDAYDSRSVIGESDAALLPGSLPGRAYLRVGLDPIQLFQTARAGARYEAQDDQGEIDIAPFLPEPSRLSLVASEPAFPASDGAPRQTEVEVLASRLVEAAEERGVAAETWPKPLPQIVPLFDEASDGRSVLGPLPQADQWQWPTAPKPDWLVASVGLADEPARQAQHPLQIDVLRNALVVGAAGSGKSTLLRTLAVSLGMTHAPEDLHVYCLDFGARSLRGLASLPHCGQHGVFFATDGDRIRRVFRLLVRELERRRAAGITNLRQQRRLQPRERSFPFLLVLLDNYPAFREIFDDGSRSFVMDNTVGDLIMLMRDGPAVGISFVVTSPQQAGISSGVFNAAEVRVALRQNEPGDYVFVGRLENPPERVSPGRAFTTGTPPVEFQVAVTETPDTPSEEALALDQLLARMRAARPGFSPLAVEELPAFLPIDDPRLGAAATPSGMPLLLGLEDEGGGPLWVDLETDAAHFLVAAPSGGGKTTLLATMLLSTLNTPVRWYIAGSRRSAPARVGPVRPMRWRRQRDGAARGIDHRAGCRDRRASRGAAHRQRIVVQRHSAGTVRGRRLRPAAPGRRIRPTRHGASQDRKAWRRGRRPRPGGLLERRTARQLRRFDPLHDSGPCRHPAAARPGVGRRPVLDPPQALWRSRASAWARAPDRAPVAAHLSGRHASTGARQPGGWNPRLPQRG